MQILLIGRVVERLIVVITGTFAIYWGYRLFLAGIVTPQDAEFSKANWKVKLKGAAPGIFFSLFGSAIVIGSWRAPLQITTNPPLDQSTSISTPSQSITYAQDPSPIFRQQIRAINTAIKIAETTDSGARIGYDEDLKRAGPALKSLRSNLLTKMFGVNVMATWHRLEKSGDDNDTHMSADDKAVVEKLKPWFEESYLDEK